ncbi:hypothetical protein F8388_016225 [Cannabis sativa]|uniref:Uncharacterized protein n=1 Tax=Cannabis sativa TaxID=3483 RepID=A0A7J6DY16_CANSA|nr:hypothetical protein F8388_016225 [Cannabis sativa]KAF4398999.1 hypothetical protein G4B88_023593 [Cannabis sativa]
MASAIPFLVMELVVYAFGKEHISEAIRNLSTKSLHLFKISVCRIVSNLAIPRIVSRDNNKVRILQVLIRLT